MRPLSHELAPGTTAGRWDVFPLLTLARRGDAQPAVAVVHQRLVDLPVFGQAHHQLRDPVGEVVAVVLPVMERLAVGRHEVFEVGVFGQVRNAGGDQLTGLYLVVVTVPQALLVIGQAAEPLLADDVLDPDQACVGGVAVEDHALMQVVAQVDAEVRRLHLPAHVVGVHVEAVEVGAHRGQRVLRLDGAGRHVEHAVLEGMALADLGLRHRFAANHNAGRGHRAGGDTHAEGCGASLAGSARAERAKCRCHPRRLPGPGCLNCRRGSTCGRQTLVSLNAREFEETGLDRRPRKAVGYPR